MSKKLLNIWLIANLGMVWLMPQFSSADVKKQNLVLPEDNVSTTQSLNTAVSSPNSSISSSSFGIKSLASQKSIDWDSDIVVSDGSVSTNALLMSKPILMQGNIEVINDASSGRVVALKVKAGEKIFSSTLSHREFADQFIEQHKTLLGIENAKTDLIFVSQATDELSMSHVRYEQLQAGLPVLGSELVLHLRPDGEVVFASVSLADNFSGQTKSVVSESQARKKALAAASLEKKSSIPLVVKFAEQIFVPFSLLKNSPDLATDLAWRVRVTSRNEQDLFSRDYFISALDGSVLFTLRNSDQLNRSVYDCGIAPGNGNCYMDYYSATYGYTFGRSESAPERGPSPTKLNILPTSTPAFSTDVDRLHGLLGQAHTFVQELFGLDGANNQGGSAVTTYGVPADASRGYVHWENTGDAMCPGGAEFMHDTGDMHYCVQMAAPDTVGHEYAHAVVYHSYDNMWGEPIGVISYSQTGALNEGHSEYMGEVFEEFATGVTDWKAGTNSSWTTLFDLSDPGTTGYTPPGSDYVFPNPERWQSRYVVCDPDFDDMGVHINGSIISHMFYRMANGGGQNGCYIEPIGAEAAAKIFVRVWRQNYLTRTATFNQAFSAIQQACSELYSSAICEQVRIALEASELDQPGFCSGPNESAPDCPLQSIDQASLYRPHRFTGELIPVTDYAVGETLAVRGCGGTPGRQATLTWRVRYSSAIPIGYEWWKMKGTYGAQYTKTVSFDSAGCFEAVFDQPLARYSNYVNYAVYIDTDNDGRWQPWSDYAINAVLINAVVAGDGICRWDGQFASTAEDCHTVPADCACTGTRVCTAYTPAPDIAYACIRPDVSERIFPHMAE